MEVGRFRLLAGPGVQTSSMSLPGAPEGCVVLPAYPPSCAIEDALSSPCEKAVMLIRPGGEKGNFVYRGWPVVATPGPHRPIRTDGFDASLALGDPKGMVPGGVCESKARMDPNP